LISALAFVLLASGLILSFGLGLKSDGPASPGAANSHARTVVLVSVTLSGKSVSGAERHLVGPKSLALSHHDSSSTTVTNKDRHPATHIAFTQVGAQRWDALASSNFHKDTAIIFGVRAVSVPIVEPQNTAFEKFGPEIEIFGDSLSAAEAHQFASSL